MASEAQIRDGVEFASWVLLTLATVGSAWCAYQASLWSGEQTRALARASVAQFSASREMSLVNRDLMVDVGTYINYVGADFRGDAKLAGFLRSHARRDFKPALDAWIAAEGAGRADVPNPFVLPEYRSAGLQTVADLDKKAMTNIATANEANSNSDAYVLHTVMFALSLFFLSATSQVRRRTMRRAMLAVGVVVFTGTVFSVSRLPRSQNPQLIRHPSPPSVEQQPHAQGDGQRVPALPGQVRERG